MNLLKVWWIIVGMFLSLSATAGGHSAELQTDNVFVEHISQQTSNDTAKMVLRRGEQENKPVFVTDAPRINNHRSVLFLADSQAKPEFRLQFELNPPDLSTGRYDRNKIDTIPWFLQSSAGKTRVSGWKDGNSLYTACITYYS
ncbi:MAG: hypothetical protein MJK04_19525 [Psychrosphaera sp.]|nr:hypothetical protein [Psychrosphaera sp.]